MDRTVQALVEFATGVRLGDLDEVTRSAARQRVVDTVGCALAGYDSPPAKVARELAQPVVGDAGARIWGSGRRVSIEDAIFANGVAVRYLDYNDTYRTLDGSHPSDSFAGLFSLAENLGASGEKFVEALVIAYEVQSRFADVVPFNTKGWDQPTAGVIAVALGAAHLLGADAEAFGNAVSLAVVPNMALHQTRCGELSWWKGCAAAMGARQGVLAARMAVLGMRGPEEPFEGANGVWFHLGERYDLPLATRDTWAIRQSNVKSWPVRDSCQLAVDTARELRADVGTDKIEKLTLQTYQSAYNGAIADPELWAPRTRETADHSMLVSVALGLLDDGPSAESFERERFLDADVLDLIGRTSVEVLDEFSAEAPGRRNCRLIAELSSGRSATAHRVLTFAEIEQGKSDAEVDDKYRRLASTFMSNAAATTLLDALHSIDRAPSVVGIVDLIRTTDHD